MSYENENKANADRMSNKLLLREFCGAHHRSVLPDLLCFWLLLIKSSSMTNWWLAPKTMPQSDIILTTFKWYCALQTLVASAGEIENLTLFIYLFICVLLCMYLWPTNKKSRMQSNKIIKCQDKSCCNQLKSIGTYMHTLVSKHMEAPQLNFVDIS